MRYVSTRGSAAVSAAQAILNGLSPDGGLYVPETIPAAPASWTDPAVDWSYQALAAEVLNLYFPELGADELRQMCAEAYASFTAPEVTPVRALDGDTWLLELYHGPTLAFKDVALQLLPRLIVRAARLAGEKRTIHILTATSGDTGKAALEGFRDVAGTACTVFYPHGGVSDLQYRQMATSRGGNVQVVAVEGNFDDAQTGVKQLFASQAFRAKLDSLGRLPSSANSINIGRLVPQIVYYFWAYRSLRRAGSLQAGEPLDICVPTGNFGDILAAWYAKRMGLPVGRLICASNRNRVLTDFLTTGVYDINRPFHKTISPSMDILISSNLERLLFELCGRDAAQVSAWMGQLRGTGRFAPDGALLGRLQAEFAAGTADDEETREAIRSTFARCGALTDPHTAVGLSVLAALRGREADRRPTLVNATASPYKFVTDVSEALGLAVTGQVFEDARALAARTATAVPDAISALETADIRHRTVVSPAGMGDAVLNAIQA